MDKVATDANYERAIRMERTMERAVLFKRSVIGLGALAIVILALVSFIRGEWVVGLLLLTLGQLVWYIVADIATGIVVAPFVGVAALRHRRR
jgi:hypothetical protein